jgi:hypothetical protein
MVVCLTALESDGGGVANLESWREGGRRKGKEGRRRYRMSWGRIGRGALRS